jgi:acetyltransferase-like isoleucine patch superfamily enzyme
MGAFSLMAGIGTRIFTHGINIVEGRQSCAPVSIGQYCQIGAGCILLKGTSLPDFSLLAVGSVLHKSYQQEYTLYSGVPAMPMRDVDRSARFFHRTKGRVD